MMRGQTSAPLFGSKSTLVVRMRFSALRVDTSVWKVWVAWAKGVP